MLILSRKVGERIVINDNITLVVVSCDGNRVRLGIAAPSEVPVYRSELLTSKAAPKQTADRS